MGRPQHRFLAILLLCVFAIGAAGCCLDCHADEDAQLYQSAGADECCRVHCTCHLFDVPAVITVVMDCHQQSSVMPDEHPALPAFIGSIFQPPRA